MIYFLICLYPAFLLWTIILITRNWMRSVKNEYRDDPKSPWLTILALLFTVVSPVLGFWRFDEFTSLGIPFSKHHVLAVEVIVAVSSLGYWMSRFYKRELPMVMNWVVRAAMLQGIVLCLVTTIHFGYHLPYGIVWPTLGFELEAPPVAALFLLYELTCNYKLVRQGPVAQPTPALRSLQWGLPVVLMVMELAPLLPFGYEWNSFLLAFTHSRDFVFSVNG
jgi:hypothetical protein